MFEQTRRRARTRARQGADQRLATAKDEIGRIAFELLEERFPEQVKERQRRDAATAFVVGVGAGILLRHLAWR